MASSEPNRDSIQEQTYSLLRVMIEDGRLLPGQKLFEAKVAQAFGISRSPARHALQLLYKSQLVSKSTHRGYEVLGGENTGTIVKHTTLEERKISIVPRWKHIYFRLERSLCSMIMFVSVRIVEEELAKHYDVSRTVAHNVLVRMQSAGLLAKDNRSGWVAHRLTSERKHSLYEIRWLLEPEALRQAFPHYPAGHVEQARNAVVEALHRDSIEDVDTSDIEHDLHVRMLCYCPNTEIIRALVRTRMLFSGKNSANGSPILMTSQPTAEALREHLAVYEHLLNKQINAAALALRCHLEQAHERSANRTEETQRLVTGLPNFIRLL